MSPCPGGHHSSSGSAGKATGSSVVASSLGDAFWSSSQSGVAGSMSSGWVAASAARVSAEVEKESMRMKRTCDPVAVRVCLI